MQSIPRDAAGTLRELVSATARHMSRGSLSRVGASTLSILHLEGAQRITVLAAREAVSQPAMTNLVQRLEAQGLVERAVDPTDARATLISVTEAGAELMLERRRHHEAELQATLDRLSPEERATIDAALPALNRFTELHESH